MKLIIGLGNPGPQYSATRHNTGFMVVEELAKRWGVPAWRNRSDAMVTETRRAEQILLVKPLSFMNLSGVPVKELAKFYKISVRDMIVVYDDLDLAVGKLRLRPNGGTGGHRGLESLLVHLGDNAFTRVRLGIGRPPQGWETAAYVLGRFTAEEAPVMAETICKAAEAIETILDKGLSQAMNIYNR